MLARFFPVGLVLLCACGGSSSSGGPDGGGADGGVHVTGTIAGVTLELTNAKTVIARRTTPIALGVEITNLADSCFANARNVKNKQQISLYYTANSAGLDAGSYGVWNCQDNTTPLGLFQVEFHTSNGTCDVYAPPNSCGASGRVTLTHADMADAGLAGDFDVILQTGDRIKGTFTAPVCATTTGTDAGCH